MSVTAVLRIVDETANGDAIQEMEVSFSRRTVTIKDVIASRVEAEVARYNAKLPEYFNGLVQPTDSEKTLNGFKSKKRHQVDAEKQVYVALDAFLKNGYFVFVDNRQAESLDEEVEISPETTVSFLKLTPMVGG